VCVFSQDLFQTGRASYQPSPTTSAKRASSLYPTCLVVLQVIVASNHYAPIKKSQALLAFALQVKSNADLTICEVHLCSFRRGAGSLALIPSQSPVLLSLGNHSRIARVFASQQRATMIPSFLVQVRNSAPLSALLSPSAFFRRFFRWIRPAVSSLDAACIWS